MFDWRMVSAAFVAFLFVSGMFVSSSAIKDFLNSLIEKISEWMKTSPFGGFFASPTKKPKEVEFFVQSKNLILTPDSKVSILSDRFAISGFRGEIIIDMDKRKMNLVESTSSVQINLTIDDEIVVDNLKLNKFSIKNAKFEINEIKTNNGSIFLNDFSGNLRIKNSNIYFKGETTSLKTKIGENVWELE